MTEQNEAWTRLGPKNREARASGATLSVREVLRRATSADELAWRLYHRAPWCFMGAFAFESPVERAVAKAAFGALWHTLALDAVRDHVVVAYAGLPPGPGGVRVIHALAYFPGALAISEADAVRELTDRWCAAVGEAGGTARLRAFDLDDLQERLRKAPSLAHAAWRVTTVCPQQDPACSGPTGCTTRNAGPSVYDDAVATIYAATADAYRWSRHSAVIPPELRDHVARLRRARRPAKRPLRVPHGGCREQGERDHGRR